MTTKKFPSEAFPMFPSVKLEAGEGWLDWNLPGSVLSLKKPKENAFTPNFLINVRTVAHNYDYNAYTAELQSYTEKLEGIKYFTNELQEVNGYQWKIEEYAYIDELSGPLAQFLAATFVESGNVKFMINFTGTVSLKEQAQNKDYLEIQNMFRSVEINA